MKQDLLVALLTLVASTTCSAEPFASSGPGNAEPSFSRSDGPPFLLDLDVDFRLSRRANWFASRAMFRMPWSRLSHDPGADARQMLGTIASFEQGMSLSTNPRRVSAMACYYFGQDFFSGGGDVLRGLGADRYPLWRCDFFNAGFGGAAGWMHAQATEVASKGDGIATQEALRFESWVHIGLFVAQHEMRVALNVHLQDGSNLSFEFGTRLSFGRPFIPGGLTVGYWYVTGPRIGGHHVTFGIEFDL